MCCGEVSKQETWTWMPMRFWDENKIKIDYETRIVYISESNERDIYEIIRNAANHAIDWEKIIKDRNWKHPTQREEELNSSLMNAHQSNSPPR
jgi:hypothetical protein